jgi:hypothetical protein
VANASAIPNRQAVFMLAAAATSSKFRRVCATRAATIGFFYAMLQKDHATEYQPPVGGIAIPPTA